MLDYGVAMLYVYKIKNKTTPKINAKWRFLNKRFAVEYDLIK